MAWWAGTYEYMYVCISTWRTTHHCQLQPLHTHTPLPVTVSEHTHTTVSYSHWTHTHTTASYSHWTHTHRQLQSLNTHTHHCQLQSLMYVVAVEMRACKLVSGGSEVSYCVLIIMSNTLIPLICSFSAQWQDATCVGVLCRRRLDSKVQTNRPFSKTGVLKWKFPVFPTIGPYVDTCFAYPLQRAPSKAHQTYLTSLEVQTPT